MKTATHNTSDDSMADMAGERAKHYVDSGVDVLNAVADKTQAVGKQVDGYVRANPWMMIGAAAGVGFLLGMLARRR